MSITAVGVTGSSPMHAMSGASAGMPPQQKMSSLFDKIDSSGTGSINQQQFAQAFQTLNPPPVFQQQGASAIFGTLDPNNTGSVSKSDFVRGMSGLMASLRADGGPSATSAPSPGASLASSLQSLSALDPTSLPGNLPAGSFLSTMA